MESRYSLDEILEYVADGMALGAVSEVVGRDGDYLKHAYYGILAERCEPPHDNVVVGTIFNGEGKILADVTRLFPRDVPTHEAARTIVELWLSVARPARRGLALM